MIDVTQHNFEQEVLEASATTPVLIDFWAPWCGPCKTLGPVLEKLEADYQGRFKLAKVDSDQEPQLAGAFGIRSIPTCVLMVSGKPVDGFMGAQSEGQLRAFLDKHLPTKEALHAEAETEAAEALIQAGDTEAALAKLAEALTADPSNEEARFDYAKLLIAGGAFEEAHSVLKDPLARIPKPLRFEALATWLYAIEYVDSQAFAGQFGGWERPQFDAKIAENKRDFETRYAKAAALLSAGLLAESMDELLEIVLRDRAWNQELARKTVVAILELLTPPKPKGGGEAGNKTAGGIELAGKAVAALDPQAEMVARYRRKLSMALN